MTEDATANSGFGDNTIEFGKGWATTLSAGYAFARSFRTEVELGYRRAPVEQVTGIGASNDASPTGSFGALSLMANAFYDFDLGGTRPYVGLGVGGARISAENVSRVRNTTLDDESYNIAFQGIAGVAIPVAPHVEVTADYRFFGTPDPDLTGINDRTYETHYTNHTMMVGLRLSMQ